MNEDCRPRRLLVIGVQWPLETFLGNLLRGLAAAGWEVTVASRRPFGREAAPLRRLALPGGGVEGLLPRLPRLALAALRRPREAARLLRGRPDKLRQAPLLWPFLGQDFDAFYFPWIGAALDYLPLFGLGVPTLLSCRGSHVQVSPHNPRRPELREKLPRLFAAATAVHGVSREILEVAEELGLDRAKAVVIPPAVDPHFFCPAPEAAARPAHLPLRLVGAGSLIWRKGFNYALRAVAELRRRGLEVTLELVGEGRDRQRLFFAIDDLDLGGKVTLAGRKSPAELREILRRSDVFLLPSLSEGISNAALEAMACGLPVVASACGGMSEAIENGRDGLLVPPCDPGAIADAVARLAADPGLRASLGAAARERICEEFALPDQIAAFDLLLRGLLRQGASSQPDRSPAILSAPPPAKGDGSNDPGPIPAEGEPDREPPASSPEETTPALAAPPPGAKADPGAGLLSREPGANSPAAGSTGSAEPYRAATGTAAAKRGRVVLVVPIFPKLSEAFVVRQFLGLLDQGWDVFVFCDRSPPEAWRLFPALERPEIRARVRVAPPTRPRWRFAWAAPRVWLRCLIGRPGATLAHLEAGRRAGGLLAALRQLYLDAELLLLAPDLVHFEFGALALGRRGLGERLGCKMAVSFRGYDLNFVGLDQPGYYAPVWREAAAAHLLGEDLLRRARSRGCPPELPTFLIPPAVDADRFPPRAERRPGPLRILSVGRLEWKKGYDDALIALDLLRRRGIPFRWRLVGDGAEIEALAFLRHHFGLENEVELAGSLPPSAIPFELAAADVFLHPAISEGFCNAVLEAQAAGLPVVVSDADGLAENVVSGLTGLVTPRRDPAALAVALESLASDPEARRRMGEAGRERAARLFTPEREIAAFEDFYRAILAPGGR